MTAGGSERPDCRSRHMSLLGDTLPGRMSRASFSERNREFGARIDPVFEPDVGSVTANRVDGNPEDVRDLLIAHTAGNHAQDFAFSIGDVYAPSCSCHSPALE